MACVLALMLVIAVGCSGSDRGRGGQETLEERVAAAVDRQLNGDTAFADVRAVLVQANGKIVFERYRESAPGDYHAVWSVTKSVVSTLVGIAVGEGRLSVDAKLSEMLPAYAAKMKPQVAAVTLEQVLTHTGGFAPDEAAHANAVVRAADPIAAILAGGSGEGAFAYSSAGAQLMSAILVEATGMSVLRYARTRLFDPLGIDTRPASQLLVSKANVARYEAADFAWPVDRAALHLAWSGLKLKVDDLVKIGQLYLNEGQWDGQQVVPATWVKAATTRHADTPGVPMDGYGFQWWVGDINGTAAYMAWGYGGQIIQVVPAHRLVVAVTTEYRPDDPHHRGINPGPLTYLIKSAIVGAFTDKTPK